VSREDERLPPGGWPLFWIVVLGTIAGIVWAYLERR